MNRAQGGDEAIPFGPGTPGEDAFTQIRRLVKSNSDEAWRRLLQVAAQTDDAGRYWVADILEDLLQEHGAPFVDRIEAELPHNRGLRRAFVDLVPIGDDALRDRLFVLRERTEREGASEQSS